MVIRSDSRSTTGGLTWPARGIRPPLMEDEHYQAT
jgi:hypothetical protein